MSKRFFPFRLSHDNAPAASRLMNPGLSLVAAPDLTDIPIDEQLAAAFNSNNAVMAYVTGLMHSILPPLQPQPDWYTAFSVQFADAKTHAMEWYNTITPGLIAIPSGIHDYAFAFTSNMVSINAALTALQQNPQNQPAQQAVRAGLQNLLSGFSTFLTATTSFQQQIDTFATNLTGDATNMQAAIQNATQTAGYDARQVTNLLQDIQTLQNQVSTWQKVLTGAAIAAGVGFSVCGIIAFFSLGLAIAFGVVGAMASIALIIASSVEIQQLSAQIAVDQSQMTDLNSSIAALKALEQMLQNLITLSQAASAQVQLIIRAWQAMETDITSVITDLNSAQGDLSSLNLVGLQNDLNHANTDWQTLRSFCLVLMGIKYNTATPATADLPTMGNLPTTTEVAAA
jgi:hypothetical protein